MWILLTLHLPLPNNPLQVEDERIKDDMKAQVQAILEMEELVKLIDTRYEELELDYNETMEDLNALWAPRAKIRAVTALWEPRARIRAVTALWADMVTHYRWNEDVLE